MTTPPSVTVLARCAELLVIDKPSGLLVHRGWGRDEITAIELVQELTGLRTVHPIGRLDRATSGVALFACTPRAAAGLSRLREARLIAKRYLALVRGQPPDEGEIDHPLPRREGGPRVPARTSFRRLETMACEPRAVSLVEVFPREGRPHQVRRHLRHLGHPLIGDTTWGRADLNHPFADRYGLRRLALHAWQVRLPGCAALFAETTQPVVPLGGTLVTAPLPDDLATPLAAMGFTPEGLTPGAWREVR